MRVERETSKHKFTPIHLILETQNEIDGIFALLDHAQLSQSVGLEGVWEKLDPYTSSMWIYYFKKLYIMLNTTNGEQL